MEQSSQMLQYFDKLPTFNFNNAKIMQNLSKCFFDLALFCKIRLKSKIYVNYAKFCIEVFRDGVVRQSQVHLPLYPTLPLPLPICRKSPWHQYHLPSPRCMGGTGLILSLSFNNLFVSNTACLDISVCRSMLFMLRTHLGGLEMQEEQCTPMIKTGRVGPPLRNARRVAFEFWSRQGREPGWQCLSSNSSNGNGALCVIVPNGLGLFKQFSVGSDGALVRRGHI